MVQDAALIERDLRFKQARVALKQDAQRWEAECTELRRRLQQGAAQSAREKLLVMDQLRNQAHSTQAELSDARRRGAAAEEELAQARVEKMAWRSEALSPVRLSAAATVAPKPEQSPRSPHRAAISPGRRRHQAAATGGDVAGTPKRRGMGGVGGALQGHRRAVLARAAAAAATAAEAGDGGGGGGDVHLQAWRCAPDVHGGAWDRAPPGALVECEPVERETVRAAAAAASNWVDVLPTNHGSTTEGDASRRDWAWYRHPEPGKSGGACVSHAQPSATADTSPPCVSSVVYQTRRMHTSLRVDCRFDVE